MIATFAAGAFLLLGWVGLLVYVLQSCGFYVVMGWFNAAGHTQGDRPYQNSGTNRHGALWHVVNLCMAGELLHNYHHHSPRSANLGFQGETDVGYHACRALAFIRLARIRSVRTPADSLAAGRRIPPTIYEATREQV
jgi:fatty-acid desaturase